MYCDVQYLYPIHKAQLSTGFRSLLMHPTTDGACPKAPAKKPKPSVAVAMAKMASLGNYRRKRDELGD